MTPTSNLIDGSDTKLEMYQDLRTALSTGIFAALVDSDKLKDTTETDLDSSSANNTSSLTHILKRAFDVFDDKGKGYVNTADIGRGKSYNEIKMEEDSVCVLMH